MYRYIALAALVLGSAALGFSMNRGGEEQFTLAKATMADAQSSLKGLVIDIDEDGLDDFLKAYWDYQTDTFSLLAQFNMGDLTFSPPTTLWQSALPDIDGCSVSYLDTQHGNLVDLNGDQFLDVVYSGYFEGNSSPDIELMGDSNCNGYLNLIFINNGSGGFACAGDVTGDGRTNVDDLLGVIGDWGCIEEGQPD